jgi:hypothetical protein
MQTGQAMVDGAVGLAGALQGDFNKSPTTGQMITGGIISMNRHTNRRGCAASRLGGLVARLSSSC